MAVATQVLNSVLTKSFDNVRWLLEDIGEKDCFWEPAEPCWSVRRRGEVGEGWGTGDWVCEDTWPPPKPLPVTTIAWRLAHLAAWTDVYRNWTFGDQSLGLRLFEVPGTLDGLAGWLYSAQDRFRAKVEVLDDAELVELRPAHYGPHLPIHRLVSGIAVEHNPLRCRDRAVARSPPRSRSRAASSDQGRARLGRAQEARADCLARLIVDPAIWGACCRQFGDAGYAIRLPVRGPRKFSVGC